jgi:hypothetical protein
MDPRLNVYVTFVADDEPAGEDFGTPPADGSRITDHGSQITDHGSRPTPSRKTALKNGASLPITGMRRKARQATK